MDTVPLFSISSFHSLLDAIELTEASISPLVRYAVVSHLAQSQEIFSALKARIIDRYRQYNGLFSGELSHHPLSYTSSAILLLEIKALWAFLDYIIKGAPLVYGTLFMPVAKDLVGNYMPWRRNKSSNIIKLQENGGIGTDYGAAGSQWCEDIVYSWNGLLPKDTWAYLYHTIRNYRLTRMLKVDQESPIGVEGEDRNATITDNAHLYNVNSINGISHDTKANVIVLDFPASAAQQCLLEDVMKSILKVFNDIRERESVKTLSDQAATQSHMNASRSDTKLSGVKRPADSMVSQAVLTGHSGSGDSGNGCDGSDEDYSPPVDKNGDIVQLRELDLPIRVREARRRRR